MATKKCKLLAKVSSLEEYDKASHNVALNTEECLHSFNPLYSVEVPCCVLTERLSGIGKAKQANGPLAPVFEKLWAISKKYGPLD